MPISKISMNYLLLFVSGLLSLLSSCVRSELAVSSRNTTNSSTIDISQLPESSDRINVYSIVISPQDADVDVEFSHGGANEILLPINDSRITVVARLEENSSQQPLEEVFEVSYYYGDTGLYRVSQSIGASNGTTSNNIADYVENIKLGQFELSRENNFTIGEMNGEAFQIAVSGVN